MPWDKNNPYFIYGLVDPKEWDWRLFGENLAKDYFKKPKAFVWVDIGKLLGLIERLNFLENELKEEEKTWR